MRGFGIEVRALDTDVSFGPDHPITLWTDLTERRVHPFFTGQSMTTATLFCTQLIELLATVVHEQEEKCLKSCRSSECLGWG